jgi:hypothetical protein
MISKLQLTIYQGDDYTATVTVLNADGTPADLDGYTPTAQIRRNVADKDPIVVADVELTVTGNVIALALSRDVTETLSGRYVWDLQLTAADGTVTTIGAGGVQVTQEVTRPEALLLQESV